MTTNTRPRDLVASRSDDSFQAVGEMEPKDLRKFLCLIALITHGGCYDEAKNDQGMWVAVEGSLSLLLARNFVELMGSQVGFDDSLKQQTVHFTTDKLPDGSSVEWRLIEESDVRLSGGAFIYRPFPGFWMSARFLHSRGIWWLDTQFMPSKSALSSAGLHRYRTAQTEVYRAFCELIEKRTYSISLEKRVLPQLLPARFARIYQELVESGVHLI